MDDIEHAVFMLARQAEALLEKVRGDEAKQLIVQAVQLLEQAASTHHYTE